MFIVIAILALCGILSGGNHGVHVPNKTSEFFPYGAMGLWTGIIYAFYAFGGIEVMGLMSANDPGAQEILEAYDMMFPEKSKKEIERMKLGFNDLIIVVQEAVQLISGTEEPAGGEQ